MSCADCGSRICLRCLAVWSYNISMDFKLCRHESGLASASLGGIVLTVAIGQLFGHCVYIYMSWWIVPVRPTMQMPTNSPTTEPFGAPHVCMKRLCALWRHVQRIIRLTVAAGMARVSFPLALLRRMYPTVWHGIACARRGLWQSVAFFL